jgi:hypothetical protein
MIPNKNGHFGHSTHTIFSLFLRYFSWSVSGTVRPSVLAVLRLITSSNFVGCTI